MRTCQECGTAVGESWEYCLRCGEELPANEIEAASGGGAVARLKAAVAPLGGRQPRHVEDAGDTETSGAGFGEAASRFWGATVPLWIAGLVTIALGVGLVLAVMLLPGGDNGALESARAESQAASAEVERLNGELEGVREELRVALERAEGAEAELAGVTQQASESQGTLAEAQERVAAVEGELETATADLQAAEEQLTARGEHIELLQECIAGMEVVVQFARSGLMGQAAQAEEVISGTCEQARLMAS